MSRNITAHLVLALFLSLFAAIARAQQEGLNDPTFNLADTEFGFGADGTVHAVAIQADSKILIGGEFTRYNEEPRSFLERVDTEGRRDILYGGGQSLNGAVHAIALQSDGKAIVGGDFTVANNLQRSRIARLRADGFVDSSFDPGTGANGLVSAVAVQSNGKVVVAGTFTTFNGLARNNIVRLNADGSVDTFFQPGIGPNGILQCLAIQPNGSILVGGNFTSWNNLNFRRVIRLNALGGLDTTFTPASLNGPVLAVALQSDGKVLAGGSFTTVDGVSQAGFVRLLSTGQRDPSVLNSPNGPVHSIAISSTGTIAVGGDFSSYGILPRQRLAILTAGGAPSVTFNSSLGANAPVNSIAFDAAERLVIGGEFTVYNNGARGRLARVQVDGTVDGTFNPLGGANGPINAVKAQSDGKLVIGGEFSFFNDLPRSCIARLNSDGSVDTTFTTGSGFAPNLPFTNLGVLDLEIEPSGKILVVGAFGSYRGTARANVLRLNADGSLDTTFVVGSGANDVTTSVQRFSDGKILIGGLFSTYNGVSAGAVARLLPSGAIDPGFNTSTGGGRVECTAIQSDGSVWIGGTFDSVNGVNCKSVAHLTTTGALDPTFTVKTAFGLTSTAAVEDIIVQPNGRVLLAGLFSTYNTFSRRGMVRILASGSLDTSFFPGTGSLANVSDLELLSDGRILAVGNFESFDSVATEGVIRLNSSGVVDSTFATLLTTTTAGCRTVELLADGRALVGGQFDQFHGVRRHGLARLRVNQAVTYCVGKLNSAGCIPAIGTNGAAPSFGAGHFQVTCSNALNQRTGLLFFGSSSVAVPFQGGTLCVGSPTRRTPAQNSNGSLSGVDCSGTHAFQFTTGELSAAGIEPGDLVFCQWWMRDPGSPSTTSLSNALRFTVML
jgi:uncharacterized delta-60 repeat protein